MSTQDGSGIPFEICNEQQNFRLLELPQSLLELITSSGLSNFTLKSAAFSSSDGASRQAPANLILCTDNQTFQVRQVQSSNSVFVLQPSEGRQDPQEDAPPSISLFAIATCAATLELVPIQPSAIAILKQVLPVYTGLESIPGPDLPEGTRKRTILEDVPISREECDGAWKELCAFEFEQRAWVPAASSLTSVWKSVILAATLRGINLGQVFPLVKLEGIVEEAGHPSVLFRAVVNRLSSEEDELMDGHAVLDRHKTIPWVGTIFLESQRDSANGTLTSDLIQDWQNHLPEAWRKHVQLDLLKGKYSHSAKNRISFDEPPNEAVCSKGAAAAKASGKASRKWHEKFKDARR